ncbi:hypothetical protein ACSFA3_21180 [Variovorax sp. RHLX14]|uniref:hypothetical protein n=1 Tax=Variovorax sp. RHLX14 TaxID=1259731 RepID=UPI003F44C87D
MATTITKLEGAQRQIDTSVDLWIEGRDSLSAFARAFGSFKVLLNLYAHKETDGFDRKLDETIGAMGWKSMSSYANFLKHADKDPDADLIDFRPKLPVPVIGLATILYKRLNGDFSAKMSAFDCWIETACADELQISEMEHDPKCIETNKGERERLKNATPEEYRVAAKELYDFFLENHERLSSEAEKARASGMTWQHFVDQQHAALKESKK